MWLKMQDPKSDSPYESLEMPMKERVIILYSLASVVCVALGITLICVMVSILNLVVIPLVLLVVDPFVFGMVFLAPFSVTTTARRLEYMDMSDRRRIG